MEYFFYHLDDIEDTIDASRYLEGAQWQIYEQRGRDYLLSRYILKTELARYAQRAIESLRFSYNEQGKPALIDCPNVHFNLSHSGRYLALALHHEPVGIDIEVMRPRPRLRSIAQRVLSEKQWEHFVEEGESPELFYAYWSACEAIIKQAGSSIWLRENYPFHIRNKRVIVEDCKKPLHVELLQLHPDIMGAIAY